MFIEGVLNVYVSTKNRISQTYRLGRSTNQMPLSQTNKQTNSHDNKSKPIYSNMFVQTNITVYLKLEINGNQFIYHWRLSIMRTCQHFFVAFITIDEIFFYNLIMCYFKLSSFIQLSRYGQTAIWMTYSIPKRDLAQSSMSGQKPLNQYKVDETWTSTFPNYYAVLFRSAAYQCDSKHIHHMCCFRNT